MCLLNSGFGSALCGLGRAEHLVERACLWRAHQGQTTPCEAFHTCTTVYFKGSKAIFRIDIGLYGTPILWSSRHIDSSSFNSAGTQYSLDRSWQQSAIARAGCS